MTLKVIGAGLGRTGTLSLKLALEHIGFGPCYHMVEVMSDTRHKAPLWIEAAKGNPDWDAIFDGYQSTTDYPACMYWRQLLVKYPSAKVILTVRDPDSWFESGSATVFSPAHRERLEDAGPLAEFFKGNVFSEIGEGVADRQFMTDYFRRWNQAVIDEVPAGKLLVYRAGDGWEPLCDFLGVPVPPEPYPRVNSREEMTARRAQANQQADPEAIEAMIRQRLADFKQKAFGGPSPGA